MRKKPDKWSSAKGIMEELHRIREQMNEERQRMGDSAWIKHINESSKRLGLDKKLKKVHAHA